MTAWMAVTVAARLADCSARWLLGFVPVWLASLLSFLAAGLGYSHGGRYTIDGIPPEMRSLGHLKVNANSMDTSANGTMSTQIAME